MITDGKSEKFQELVDSFLDREQTVVGHAEVRKRLYPQLPIERKPKPGTCTKCGSEIDA